MRKAINFNVILGPHPDLSRRKVEKSVTLNVSQGGCYLYSVRKWKANETAWFVFKELDDLTPIQADVRWCVPWGTSMKIPGIGVQFRNLQDTHLEQFIKEYHI
jgi:Tfp pilus assembly protein PilZ